MTKVETPEEREERKLRNTGLPIRLMMWMSLSLLALFLIYAITTYLGEILAKIFGDKLLF